MKKQSEQDFSGVLAGMKKADDQRAREEKRPKTVSIRFKTLLPLVIEKVLKIDDGQRQLILQTARKEFRFEKSSIVYWTKDLASAK